jgi:hypothetical protein
VTVPAVRYSSGIDVRHGGLLDDDAPAAGFHANATTGSVDIV